MALTVPKDPHQLALLQETLHKEIAHHQVKQQSETELFPALNAFVGLINVKQELSKVAAELADTRLQVVQLCLHNAELEGKLSEAQAAATAAEDNVTPIKETGDVDRAAKAKTKSP